MRDRSIEWTAAADSRIARALFVCACPMKCHRSPGSGPTAGSLLGELLLPVLADIAHAERVERFHEGCRVELRHHDARDLRRIAARRARGSRDPFVDLDQATVKVDGLGEWLHV